MKIFAFIFARGGSVGLPKKNIKLLGGIPLLGHSINIAKQIPEISKIFVSTDCDEIAKTAESYNVEVIKRPPELATSQASEWLAWKHSVDYLNEKGLDFDIFLSLPTTSPLRITEDVKNCIQNLDSDTDMVVTVTSSNRNPYFNMVNRDPHGYSNILLNQSNFTRRQDAPSVYDMTTVAYVTRPNFILNNNGVFSGKVKSVIIPKERSIDIDDKFDFMIAEALYNQQNGNK